MKTLSTYIAVLIFTAALFTCDRNGPPTVDTSQEPEVWKPVNSGSQEQVPQQESPGTSYYPKPEGAFRIVSYNVGAFSKYMTNSTDMVANMIVEAEADAVGLNECDSVNRRHLVNQTAELSKAVGNWQWWFGRAMPFRDGAYGNGVIVPQQVRILRKYTIPLAKGSGAEQRSVAVVETDKYVIGAAHLDHTSAQARLEQVATVDAWADMEYQDAKVPVFFVGDMNASPDSETIAQLKHNWTLLSVTTENTYPSQDSKKCIDYIFHYKKSAAVTPVGSHVMTQFNTADVTLASDHLPIYADVRF